MVVLAAEKLFAFHQVEKNMLYFKVGAEKSLIPKNHTPPPGIKWSAFICSEFRICIKSCKITKSAPGYFPV